MWVQMCYNVVTKEREVIKMIEIARIMTFGTINRRDIVRRLMAMCDSFKNLIFKPCIFSTDIMKMQGLLDTAMVGWLYTTIARIEGGTKNVIFDIFFIGFIYSFFVIIFYWLHL